MSVVGVYVQDSCKYEYGGFVLFMSWFFHSLTIYMAMQALSTIMARDGAFL
jgi:hypothetical protein